MDKNINISGISELVIGCYGNEKKMRKVTCVQFIVNKPKKRSIDKYRNTIDIEFKMYDIACNKIVHSKMCPLSNREYPEAVTH